MEKLLSMAENNNTNYKGKFAQWNISNIIIHVAKDNVIFLEPVEK